MMQHKVKTRSPINSKTQMCKKNIKKKQKKT